MNHISGGNEEHFDANRADELGELVRDIDGEWPDIKAFIDVLKNKSLNRLGGSISISIKELKSHSRELTELVNRRIPEPKYRIEINGGLLADRLQNEQQNLRSMITKLQTQI